MINGGLRPMTLEILQSGVIYIMGRDRMGRPIIVGDTGRLPQTLVAISPTSLFNSNRIIPIVLCKCRFVLDFFS